MSKHEDFDSSEVVIERKGKTRTFNVSELSHGAFLELASVLNHQDAEKQRQGRENFSPNLIARACSENGEQLTFDQAKALPQSIAMKLSKEIGRLNGTDDNAKDIAKNV
jgi:hypothetical protein